jgi:hypothetical protein
MPGGYGTKDTPWGAAGDTGYQAPAPSGGGQQGGPGHPGGYDPNRNRPQVTAPVVPAPVETWTEENPEIDYFDETYVSPQTGKTVKTMQDEAYATSQAQEAERMLQMQEAQGLASALGHIDKEQLQSYMDSGVLPAEIAARNPELAKLSGYDSAGNPIYVDPKTGKAYDPRGKFTAGMSDMLSELQFMQDEGVYGGVSGLEAEVNKQKGSVVNAIAKMKDQGLNDNQINERLKKDKNFQSLTALFGGNAETAFQNLSGYDPTGVHTWSEIESDPVLYEKYLNRGTLWDDPLSGIVNPPKEVHQGEPGGGRYGRRYGRGAYDRKMALLRALRKGSPIKQLEKSPFMSGMVPAYEKEMRETGEKGIFAETTLAGLKPKDMQRLIKSWGSGYSNPVHANVAARGGIMSAWNNMRR